MKKYRLFPTICLVAATLLIACSQDEPSSPTGGVEGASPLQIGSVSISAEAGGQPWTRVAESTDGQSSVWSGDDEFQVKFDADDDIGTYRIADDGTVKAIEPVYWHGNTQSSVITAWHTSPTVSADGTIDLSNQSDGLAYVLHAETTATFGNSISLSFTHQLAKVRVVPGGTQKDKVSDVEIYGHTSCTHTQGTINTGSVQPGWIKMRHATYGDTECWEANVVPGAITPTNLIRINGQIATVNNDFPSTLEAAKMYTIDLTVGDPVVEDGANLDKEGTYTMQGNYTQGITISGDNITVKLDNVTLETTGIGIDVQSDATIQVSGANNTINSSSAGIYVAEGKTVTIMGSNRSDKLTTSGGNGAGIGGYVNGGNSGAACGNIIIRNVTVTSYGSYNDLFQDQSAGIGGASRGACGTITIENAAVYAYGAEYVTEDINWAATPAIGSGYPSVAYPTGGIPVVTISGDSEVHAHRGGAIGNTDYIGWGGHYMNLTDANNAVNLGSGGKCTNSTIYCYTGESVVEHTYVYDDQGNRTEQSQ